MLSDHCTGGHRTAGSTVRRHCQAVEQQRTSAKGRPVPSSTDVTTIVSNDRLMALAFTKLPFVMYTRRKPAAERPAPSSSATSSCSVSVTRMLRQLGVMLPVACKQHHGH